MSENETIPKKCHSQINKAVFFTSALLIFLLVAFAAAFPDVADKNFKLLQQQIFTNASWFYILAVALILLSVTGNLRGVQPFDKGIITAIGIN